MSLEHSDTDHDADNQTQKLDSISGQAVGTLGARAKGKTPSAMLFAAIDRMNSVI